MLLCSIPMTIAAWRTIGRGGSSTTSSSRRPVRARGQRDRGLGDALRGEARRCHADEQSARAGVAKLQALSPTITLRLRSRVGPASGCYRGSKVQGMRSPDAGRSSVVRAPCRGLTDLFPLGGRLGQTPRLRRSSPPPCYLASSRRPSRSRPRAARRAAALASGLYATPWRNPLSSTHCPENGEHIKYRDPPNGA